MYEQDFEQKPKKMSGCAKAGIGCGIALVILLIIGAIGAWWVAVNAKSWGASLFTTGVNVVLDQSSLADDQKQAIKTRVDQVSEDFVAGKITVEQFTQAVDNLDVESLVGAGVAQYMGSGLIEASELSAEEKERGRVALNRVAHGLLEGQIDVEDFKDIMSPVMVNPDGEDLNFKQNPTNEELTQVMDDAADLADKAGVPEQVEELDFASKVNEAFDEALGTTQP